VDAAEPKAATLMMRLVVAAGICVLHQIVAVT
jgi:hypothetical protein